MRATSSKSGLSTADHDEYALLKDRVPGLLTSLLALPALAEAIRVLHSASSDYGGWLWFGRLQHILLAQDISPDNPPLVAAQKSWNTRCMVRAEVNRYVAGDA